MPVTVHPHADSIVRDVAETRDLFTHAEVADRRPATQLLLVRHAEGH